MLPAGDGTAYRLIGVGASDLRPAQEADRGELVDASGPDPVAREARRAAAIDRVRERFGLEAVQRGLAFRRER